MNTNERSPILTLHITSPFREEFASHGQGVAILIFNSHGEILLVQEGHDDPSYGRTKGQWNFLTETREPEEGLKSNVMRALREELCSEYSYFSVVPGSYRETNGVYNETMGYTYKYRCVCLRYDGDPNTPASELFSCPSNEIMDYRWVSQNDLQTYDVEHGARKVIEYYQGINIR